VVVGFVIVKVEPLTLRTPTGVRLWETSTARLTVIAAAASADETEGSVAEREDDLFPEAVPGVPPVREERPDVLAQLLNEGRHGLMVGERPDAVGASFRVHGM
jgi:hypothetical protein